MAYYKSLFMTIVLGLSTIAHAGETTVVSLINKSDKTVYATWKLWWWRGKKSFVIEPKTTFNFKEKAGSTLPVPWAETAGSKVNEFITVLVGSDNENMANNVAKIQEQSGWEWGWEPTSSSRVATSTGGAAILEAIINITGDALSGIKLKGVDRHINIEQKLSGATPVKIPIDKDKYDKKTALLNIVVYPDYSVGIAWQ